MIFKLTSDPKNLTRLLFTLFKPLSWIMSLLEQLGLMLINRGSVSSRVRSSILHEDRHHIKGLILRPFISHYTLDQINTINITFLATVIRELYATILAIKLLDIR